MKYLNDNIIKNICSYKFPLFCSSILVFHYFGKKYLNYYKNKNKLNINVNNTLYFIMHFIFNTYCVVYSYKNMINTFNNPLIVKQVPNVLSFYTVLFHIYHSLFYWKTLALDEKIHHMILVFILCPLTWIYYINLCDFGMFFMTGLPGGITYLLLSFKNINIINNKTEKKISKHLNLWIRAPGCVITSYIIYLNYINNSYGNMNLIKNLAIQLSIIGSLWNGMYFTNTIIESYALCKNT